MHLILGDCIEKMKDIPDGSVDLVLTSPPYDNLRSYNGQDAFTFEVFKPIAEGISRVLSEGAVAVWIVNDATVKGSETGSSFRQALYFKDLGLNLHDTMIWKKDSFVFPESTRYYPIFEYMFVFTKGKIKTFNPLKDRENKHAGLVKDHREYDKRSGEYKKRNKKFKINNYGYRVNVWEVPTGHGKTGYNGKDHPAVMPLRLAQDHVKSWSYEGDIVIDPFMGSGTTGVASKILGRDFIGIEKDQDYFEIAKKRIKECKKL